MNKTIFPANPKEENILLKEEILAKISDVIEKGRYILGDECKNFEHEFANFIGSKFAVGVASGTDAIKLSLLACDIKPGDEIITVSHSAVATTSAIVSLGALPVFVDIDPDTYTINPQLIRKEINKKTKAILPVHIYGHPANMDEIIQIAREFNLLVIEDCAQAHGAEYKGEKVGSIGDLGAFSFYPTKNLGAIGDGGIITTSNQMLFEKILLLQQYGWKERYISSIHGENSRLDELQAAILRIKLSHLEENNNKRRKIADFYQKKLIGIVELPIEKENCRHSYHQFVIKSKERDSLKLFLKNLKIETLVHYPLPIHLQPAYKKYLSRNSNLSNTERIKDMILSLPMHPFISSSDLKYICDSIHLFTKKSY